MVRNIAIEKILQTPIEKQNTEIAERKCIGHPDSLADGIAEAVSRALSKAYLEECDAVLHHNTDQGEIVAGESMPKFGGGTVTKPVYVLLTGRATKSFEGKTIPTDAIAVNAARDYLRNTLEYLNMEHDVIVDCRMGVGSSDLRDVFKANGSGRIPHANDTSFGIGHAPFSDLENIILNVSDHIDNNVRAKHPIIGTDVKIMGLRQNDDITLTLCVPMIDRFCSDMGEYIEAVEFIKEEVRNVASGSTKRNVNVAINTGDRIDQESIFLTVTGTSAEMGDDGSVGRGNRCNGLITPQRPMSMEATSGKNPINHIGKIYNLLSTEIAKKCVAEVEGIDDLYIRLLSQIGKPIDQPLVASAQYIANGIEEADKMEKEIYAIIDDSLANVTDITERVIRGELRTF
ncbi:methionine adenosyltransferase [Methanoplanus sp. FWC-SCC4]|uniref:Methionine adenosyltransferase n=1 Tax=Methanochimaera problematica TaxID=2609417 RepID=A0AA97FBF7_9EURY|nr:methionine adenosyltransferase [Methanoplanus sp. FWC-SCC4]WOF15467.1 methionine adenosyltransferase [Methanoplanus sp. FWC-SCC4]